MVLYLRTGLVLVVGSIAIDFSVGSYWWEMAFGRALLGFHRLHTFLVDPATQNSVMIYLTPQARSQVSALGARAPPAILVHPLALLSAPPIGIEDLKVDTVNF